MSKKLNPYSSYGQKLISLFARLLFSNESHALTDLSRWLKCSKQTIIRLIGDMQRSYGVNVEETFEGNRRYYRIKKTPGKVPAFGLTQNELSALNLCRAFTQSLLGAEFVQVAAQALDKGRTLMPDKAGLFHHFGTYRPGSIDYTPHQNVIRALMDAMEAAGVCRIKYKDIMDRRAKTYDIIPLKIFSYYDTIYVDYRVAKETMRSNKTKQPEKPLAIHRIQDIEITDRVFEYPQDYDFEEVFNNSFGIVKEKAFTVEVEFKGYSAQWVQERVISPDQVMEKKPGGVVCMSFSVSSDWEFMEWLLSFEDEARLIKPDWLVERVRDTIEKMQRVYMRD